MRRLAGTLVVAGLVAVGPVWAQPSSDLSGRWVREGSLGPGLDDVAPAWEEIAVVDGTVTLRRAPATAAETLLLSESALTVAAEVYAADDVERESVRTRTRRQCRSRWEAGQFVVECRQTDGGPGGQAPPIQTREVRFVEGDGRLVLELTWQSEDRVVSRRALYRRPQP